jgi:hypothetical protein
MRNPCKFTEGFVYVCVFVYIFLTKDLQQSACWDGRISHQIKTQDPQWSPPTYSKFIEWDWVLGKKKAGAGGLRFDSCCVR